MFKVFQTFFITAFFLVISACSSISTNYWYLSTDTLIVQGEFNQALKQLKKDGKDKQYILVRNKAIKHGNKKLNVIEALINKKQWAIAKHELNRLTETHPPLQQFSRIKNIIDKGEKEENRTMKTELALAKINFLNAEQKSTEFERRRKNIDSNWSYEETELQNKKLHLADKLYVLSLQALDQQDYFNAQKTYTEAIKINPKLSNKSLSIESGIGLRTKNNISIKSKQTLLTKQLNNAISNDDYDGIFVLQKILSKTPFEGKRLSKTLKRATEMRFKRSKLLDKQADTFYRVGKIANAIELWQEARLLSPENPDFFNKLTRASKVQSKLIKLRENID
jgi:tetratricopeptide (TPR) repeat protein